MRDHQHTGETAAGDVAGSAIEGDNQLRPPPAERTSDGDLVGNPRLGYSVSEAAGALGFSTRHVRNLIDRGEIPATRFGRRIVVPVESLRRRVESGGLDDL